MRWHGTILLLVAIATFARAEDWTTADGKTYKDVVVVDQEADGVRIKYLGGVGIIPYYELSDDLLKRFGRDAATLALKKAAEDKAAADAALKAQQDAAALKKEQDEAAAAQAQNASTQPANPAGSAPSAPGVPGSQSSPSAPASSHPPAAPGTAPVPGTAATESANSAEVAPSPSAAPLPATEDNPYPNSKFQYSDNLDVSYLDSVPIDLIPISLDASPSAAPPSGQGATLFLRVETEGQRAEAPDAIVGIFNSPAALKKLATDDKVKFLVDGTYIVGTPAPVDSDVTPNPALSLTQVIFTLNPEQMRSVIQSKNVNVSVGSYDFRVDDAGVATLRAYLTDVDHLPPPSTNVVRAYHRLINRLPSIVTMISTSCEYIILGAFAILMIGAIAAFIMGLTRFIQM